MQPRLFVPGWGGSGPEHWQSRWQSQLRGSRRVEVPDWFAPERGAWVDAIERAVRSIGAAAQRAPILIAHSLGCIAVAAWAEQVGRGAVAAALLVAPPDIERADAAAVLRDFGPVPKRRLGFACHVVASDDDPYVSVERATQFAAHWGAPLTVLAGAGHINVASGHGAWPAGLELVRQLAVGRAA